MGKYRFSSSGEISRGDGQVVGHVAEGGQLELADESLASEVLKDLRSQIGREDSQEWTDNLLAAANLPSKGLFRIACIHCDTNEGDWVDLIPEGWVIHTRVQSLEDSMQQTNQQGHRTSAFEWYTHLGCCPNCREES